MKAIATPKGTNVRIDLINDDGTVENVRKSVEAGKYGAIALNTYTDLGTGRVWTIAGASRDLETASKYNPYTLNAVFGALEKTKAQELADKTGTKVTISRRRGGTRYVVQRLSLTRKIILIEAA